MKKMLGLNKKDILSNVIVRWTMFTFGFALVFIGVIATVVVNVGGGTVIIVTGMAFILLAVFEVQSLELLGLSAKLKGRLNEAEALLDKIRKVSVPLTQLAVMVAIRSGRWDSYIPSIKVYEPLKEIEKELVGKDIATLDEFMEIKSEVIENMIKELNELLINKIKSELDDQYRVVEIISKTLQETSDPKYKEKIKSFATEMQELSKEKNKVISLNQIDTKEINSKIKDYLLGENSLPQEKKEIFINEAEEIEQDTNLLFQTGDIRRPDVLKEVR